jgi:hypothetical protein
MKKLLPILTVAFMIVSCSRSGTTVANDDSTINNQLANPGSGERRVSDIPVTEKEVPVEVTTAFYSRYSYPQNVQWLWLRDGNYRVDFFIGKTKWMAIYAPDGRLLYEEHT